MSAGKLLVNLLHTHPTLLIALPTALMFFCTANVDLCTVLHAHVLLMIWVIGAVAPPPAFVATIHSCVTILGAGESTWVMVTWHGD